MFFKKHEAAPPPKGVHEQAAQHHYLQRWDPAHLASVYLRLLRASLDQEPKYFDE